MKPALSKQEKKFKKLKSYSCPHLVMTSSQTLPGPALAMLEMRPSHSVSDIKDKQLQLNPSTAPCNENQGTDINTSGTTPCITITPPSPCWEPRRSLGNSCTDKGFSTKSWISDKRSTKKENYKLNVCNIDVHL